MTYHKVHKEKSEFALPIFMVLKFLNVDSFCLEYVIHVCSRMRRMHRIESDFLMNMR